MTAGGRTGASPYSNVIDYVTIATTGNSTDFGDLTNGRAFFGSAGSPTRLTFGGGALDTSGNTTNTIDYVTIATTGNAIDFGDLYLSRYYVTGCSNGHGGLAA